MYKRKDDKIWYDPNRGQTMERKGGAVRIHWSAQMLDYLRRHFATTMNDELAGCLGVSPRTMIRKARELGLEKDPAWLREVWEERRRWAHIESRRKGYPGTFRKGEHSNPDGEFKPGRKPSAEETAKRIESMKRWYRRHPDKAKAKAVKGGETRRRNLASANFNS